MRKIVALFILFFATQSFSSVEKKKNVLNQLKLFGDIFERVRGVYVEPVSDEKLMEYAINGMLMGLDPHSSYLNQENFKEIKMHTKGEFGGLGMEVSVDNGFIKVMSPIDDTPAFRAGIKPGDYITAVDGKSIIGLGLQEAVAMMRGEPNTSITLTILRPEIKDPFDIQLTRDTIKISSVKSQVYDDILYVRIASFTEKTSESLKNELKKYNIGNQNSTINGVLMDLRNNPGGLLEQAIGVSDVFLPQGEIVSTRGRNKEDIKRYNATEKDFTNGVPVVILINEGTASASEIVAGALQDHKRALIVGTKSFGKGSVQSIIPFQDDVAIRITTARYYTPSGRSIQADGIVPDIYFSNAKVEFVNRKTTKESDLLNHLDNKQKTNKSEYNIKDKEAMYKNDYQMAMAYDILKSIIVYKKM